MIRNLSIYLVNAFVGPGYKGNHAAICILNEWLPAPDLQSIALRIGVAETAFVKKAEHFVYWDIRWFTPEIEMDLCGHATLAAAYVLFQEPEPETKEITFHSLSGKLTVTKNKGQIVLDFPSRQPEKCILPDVIVKGMGLQPLETYKSRDYILVYEDEKTILRITPNRAILDRINLDPGGIVVTAKGKQADFVLRYFTPQASIFEDPVTGSAHCSLIPYWSQRLNKTEMVAEQLSGNKGILYCSYDIDRVRIGGYCIIYNKETLRY